ncbi:hypothetical protein MNBD_GAMMA09-2726 [hydrothermal vent metagenome]|uniref:Carrier domain-containing protein n=1 Tax=hydrothermal vent metagenome TaxID=652676 RepID=A0A3B0XQW8_9ZZZZ
MGLDTVELLMAIEDEFGIHIDDDDALKLTTPEEAANYVYSRVRQSIKDPCLSQKGFYKLRKIIATTFHIDRKQIKSDSSLEELLGDNININWVRLKDSIGVKDFQRLKRSNVLFFGVGFILPFIAVFPFLLNGAPLELILISFFIISIVLNSVTYKMGNLIPAKYSNVRSLIPYVECSRTTVWEKDIIIKHIIEITSEQLGIPVDKINKNSHFVRELGAS